MQANSESVDQRRVPQRIIQGPPQLPPLFEGQKIKSGPYTITVTRDMVERRQRENEELYRAWLNEQQRRAMSADREEDNYLDDFKDGAIRKSFIRKVFCILTLQLLFTAAVIAIFLFIESARLFMIVHWYLWVAALVGFIVSYCAISCSVNARRQVPYNYILLIILTLAMSYLSAFASVYYSVEIILLTISMTGIIAFIVGLTATFCKFDLTMRMGMMVIIGWVAIISILVMTIILAFTYVKVLHVIIAIIGTLLLSMTIMGGRRVELSPDEVVFATVQIYVDLVLLYQYILMCMGILHDG